MRLLLSLALCVGLVSSARAEVLVRWDADRVPAMDALGIHALLIPVDRLDAIRDAAGKGYRVYVEVDAGRTDAGSVPPMAAGGVVIRGAATDTQVRRLRAQLAGPGARLITLDQRGKWPHVRLNEVTKRNDVLQVASRTAQPWLENNGALVSIANLSGRPDAFLAYAWTPLTASDEDEGPALEHYLLAIAEAGSTGASLVLPLHTRFQQALLQGRPEARRDWAAIRSALEFHAWDAPRQFEPVASVGVVSTDPAGAYEMLNLLTRHNVSYAIVRPADLVARGANSWPLIVVADEPGPAATVVLAEAEARGVTLLRPEMPLADPNAFAMDVRNGLGPERRFVDVWNGITVLVSARYDPADGTVLLSLVNYAHDGRPVQVRVRGTFSAVEYESPEQPAMLVPFTHRGGGTEFVVPSLRVGGRVFLRPEARTLR